MGLDADTLERIKERLGASGPAGLASMLGMMEEPEVLGPLLAPCTGSRGNVRVNRSCRVS